MPIFYLLLIALIAQNANCIFYDRRNDCLARSIVCNVNTAVSFQGVWISEFGRILLQSQFCINLHIIDSVLSGSAR